MLSPSQNGGPQVRASSPVPGGSILTTSAPSAASTSVQYGPASDVVTSTTRMPSERQEGHARDATSAAEPATRQTVAVNRLAQETSPYLLQHADNPVDWYPWGEEALARARDEDRPILLSIGYAACHWCHVMEHESFEDARDGGADERAAS